MTAILCSRPSGRETSNQTPRSLEIQLQSTAEEFALLQSDWNALVSRTAKSNIFLTWEWLWTWWEEFGSELRPRILVAREAVTGRPVAIAPFALRQCPLAWGPCRELLLVGSTIASGDHLDILAEPEAEEWAAEQFAAVLQSQPRNWNVIALDRMLSDSPLVRRLREQNDRAVMAWESVCPILVLPDRWSDLLATLDRRVRQKVRSSACRLEKETRGAVEYWQAGTPEELSLGLYELFRLHQERWTARGKRGAFCQPKVCRFHRRVAVRFLEKGWLRLYLLKACGKTIAAAYCFRLGDTVSYYQTGYDEAWSWHRPGLLIMAHAIQRSIEEGARRFDFLRGEHAYKREWTNTVQRDVRLRLATTTAGGAIVRTYAGFRSLRQRIRNWGKA